MVGALSLLTNQTDKGPAEQKHAASYSYFPLAALCSFHSQNASQEIVTTPHIRFFPLRKITDYGQGGFRIKEHKSFITSLLFLDFETRHIYKFSFFQTVSLKKSLQNKLLCIPEMGSSVLAMNAVSNFYTVITEAQRQNKNSNPTLSSQNFSID